MNTDKLKEHSGKGNKPAYVAYKGKIYDVSGSALWRGGTHMSRHQAGEDLSEFMPLAPHGEEMLARLKEVDTLDSPGSLTMDGKEVLRALYRKFHPHPITIHFPLGISFFAALMQAVYLLAMAQSFDFAAFYALVIAALTIFPAIAAGTLSWWINYNMTMTAIFRNKLIFSAISGVLLMAAVLLRLSQPGLVFDSSSTEMIYSALIFLNIPCIFFVAANGGKITWPS